MRSSTYSKTPQAGLRALLRADEIQERVKSLAAEISRDYGHGNPLIVAVLKGAFVFLADLIRYMDSPVEIEFIRLASYGPKTQPSGEVKTVSDLVTPVEGRDVLIVEDIVDTGYSLEFLTRLLRERGAKSVRTCSLLDKPSRRVADVTLDYIGFVIPDVFVVGYGIDYSEHYRNLPDIYAINTDDGEESRES